MQSEERFRSALGGYKKEDVNRYIKETDMANAAQLDTLHKQLDELSDEIDKTRKEIDMLTAANEDMTTKLSEVNGLIVEKDTVIAERDTTIRDLQKRLDIAKAQTDAQNTVMEKLKKEVAALNERIAESDTKIAFLEKVKAEAEVEAAAISAEKDKAITACAEIEKAGKASVQRAIEEAETRWKDMLTDAVAAEKARGDAEIDKIRREFDTGEESIGYKLRMYDKISGQIGDILLNANRNADDILAAAQEEADKLRSDAMEEANWISAEAQAQSMRTRTETEEEAAYIRDRLSDTAEQLLTEISGDLHDNVGSCLREVDTCISEMQSDIETVLNTIKARYREMNDRILYYQSCVTDAVSDKLHDMDVKYGIPLHKENVE